MQYQRKSFVGLRGIILRIFRGLKVFIGQKRFFVGEGFLDLIGFKGLE